MFLYSINDNHHHNFRSMVSWLYWYYLCCLLLFFWCCLLSVGVIYLLFICFIGCSSDPALLLDIIYIIDCVYYLGLQQQHKLMRDSCCLFFWVSWFVVWYCWGSVAVVVWIDQLIEKRLRAKVISYYYYCSSRCSSSSSSSSRLVIIYIACYFIVYSHVTTLLNRCLYYWQYQYSIHLAW